MALGQALDELLLFKGEMLHGIIAILNVLLSKSMYLKLIFMLLHSEEVHLIPLSLSALENKKMGQEPPNYGANWLKTLTIGTYAEEQQTKTIIKSVYSH